MSLNTFVVSFSKAAAKVLALATGVNLHASLVTQAERPVRIERSEIRPSVATQHSSMPLATGETFAG